MCTIPLVLTSCLGIYLLPSFIIPRALGGVFYWFYTRKANAKKDKIIMVASGMILGESIASLVSVALTAAGAPRLGGG